MKSKILFLIICLFIMSEANLSHAYPKGYKKCPKKIILPGHEKPIRHNKARRMKNGYF